VVRIDEKSLVAFVLRLQLAVTYAVQKLHEDNGMTFLCWVAALFWQKLCAHERGEPAMNTETGQQECRCKKCGKPMDTA